MVSIGGKRSFQLEQNEGTIIGQENIKNYITEFYKNLFGPPSENYFSLLEDEIHDIPQLSQIENEFLTANFTEQEVCEAIMNMEKNKARGPDGFPAEFYQTFWSILKDDVMKMFVNFQQGNLQLFKLNYGTIILLAKKENAIQIQEYRPICF
jgi:hypothetical protein